MSQANVLDPKIMRATDDFHRLEVKLRQFAVLDYRAVALPLVKSLLQVCLQGLKGGACFLKSGLSFFYMYLYTPVLCDLLL